VPGASPKESPRLSADEWPAGAMALLKGLRPGHDVDGSRHGERTWWRALGRRGQRLHYLLRSHGPMVLRLLRIDRQTLGALRREIEVQRALARLVRE
jgi:hypothetical protein